MATPAAAILPISISEQDAPEDDSRVGWAGIGPTGKTLGDRIGKRTANGVVGLGDGVERTWIRKHQQLRGEVIIDDKEDGEDRNGERQLLVVWTDGSRDDSARVGAAAVYKHKDTWHTVKRHELTCSRSAGDGKRG